MIHVAIVGGGPAAILAALILARIPGVIIYLFEEGHPVEWRICPHNTTGKCVRCKVCSIVKGIAGGGAGSDGKFLPSKGGELFNRLGDNTYQKLMEYTASVYAKYAKMAQVTPNIYGTVKTPYIMDAEKMAREVGLIMELHQITHYGSDGARAVFYQMQETLRGYDNVHLYTNTRVTDVNFKTREVHTTSKKLPRKLFDYILLAPGRSGSYWVSELCKKNGIDTSYGNLVLGVRAEVPDWIDGHPGPLVQANKDVYEAKLRLNFPPGSFVKNAKTFCQCSEAEIAYEYYGPQFGIAPNGASSLGRKFPNSNVSLLLGIDVNQVKDPASFIWKFVKKANQQGNGYPICQTYRAFCEGFPSTIDEFKTLSFKSTEINLHPGDLTKVFNPVMSMSLIDFIERINQVFPGFTVDGDLLLHGVEVKPVSFTPTMDELLQIAPGIFAAGDGVNLSHGLQPASGSGIYTALMMLKNMSRKDTSILAYYDFLKKEYCFLPDFIK